MRLALLLAVALPCASAFPQDLKRADPDTARARSIGVHIGGDTAANRGRRRDAKRVPVTAAHQATAFVTPEARALLLRAREARLRVDSTLQAYDARAFRRLSVGMGLRVAGRERLLMRSEQAQRIRWDRTHGAIVSVTGSRTRFPMIGRWTDEEDLSGLEENVDLPYSPGRDRLWPLGSSGVQVNEREVVHPLADGSEAYYRYAIGDSMTVRLMDGREYRLVELRVRPREERWNTVVGSLWFDRAGGQLVRAAYRLSAPLDVWLVARESEEPDSTGKVEDPQGDVPVWLRPALNPMRATVSAITQEFALQEQRWWLPVAQQAEGIAEVGKVRLPIAVEERFSYSSVSATPMRTIGDSLLAQHLADSLGRDSLDTVRAVQGDPAHRRARARRDSVLAARLKDCRAARTESRTVVRSESGTRVLMVIPCDTAALRGSPDLPATLYSSTEELFGETERAQLVEYALGFMTQAEGGGSRRPTFYHGLGGGLLRYNRVEGLAVGLRAEQALGAGYTAGAAARLATANLHPGGDLFIQRSDGRRILGARLYHRLDLANDYGDPFSLGASLGALLFGRDDGFYYRATGLELTRSTIDGRGVEWTLFGEHHGDAPVATQASFANLVGNTRFRDNIGAERGDIAGVRARVTRTFGLDPQGWRLLADVKAEGAGGTFDYGRGLVDLTASRGLGPWLAGAVTAAAGIASDDVPLQRNFFVGGIGTVRGQRAGERVGPAFWLGRAEVGSSFVGARPVVFADLGWAGERSAWSHPGRPISGGGVGVSFLDGLVRFDLAKGVRPSRGVRADLYLEARF